MPAVARVTDIGSAHSGFPDSDVIEGSSDTDVNSLAVHLVSHAIRAHPHGRRLAVGSPNLDINSLPVGRIGDSIDCGGFIKTGSPDTILN